MTNLLANIIVLTSLNLIPTNTPAFQNYALHTMLTNVEVLVAQWGLDMRQPIKTNTVTHFQASPQPEGIRGNIVFNNRYLFRFNSGWLTEFNDLNEPSVFTSEDARKERADLKRRLEKTNLLTLEKAEKISESVLRSWGEAFAGTNFSKPSIRQQMRYYSQDAIHQLPYYEFEWKKSRRTIMRVEVSGIISNVVSIETSLPSYKLPQPTNYLEMLGLSTNTVFVRRRPQPPPLPPRYEVYQP